MFFQASLIFETHQGGCLVELLAVQSNSRFVWKTCRTQTL